MVWKFEPIGSSMHGILAFQGRPGFTQRGGRARNVVFYSVVSISAQKWEPIYSFCVDLFESIAMEHYRTWGFLTGFATIGTCCELEQSLWVWRPDGAYRRRLFSGALKAGLTVQRVTCTCMGAGLAVRRVLCTSSQLAWTCRESFARSSFREIQSIDILVPKIWYHVPHPSNDQNMPKTTPFRWQKRRFLDGLRLRP